MIEVEFSRACCNITPERLAALRAAGVPDEAFAKHLVGMAQIETHAGGLFDFAGDDVDVDLAVLLPAGEWDGLNWILDDIVAFHLDHPGRWWRRLGAVQVLGAPPVAPEPVFPLRLYDTPLSWLQAQAAGACVVDWRVDPERFLYVGPIEAESHSLKARFGQRIQSAALAKFQISIGEVRNAA